MSKILRLIKSCAPALLLVPIFFSDSAHAALPTQNILDDVVERFATQAGTWHKAIEGHAIKLFWILNIMSLAWGLATKLLSKPDIPDVFSEVFRHVMFTGFHYWLLTNGPLFASMIIASMRLAAGSATGVVEMSPSDIVDVGLNIASKALANFSALSPVDSVGYILVSIVILICLALIAANMVIMLCSAWVLTYAGVIFLGFGGGRWTSDIAINYYKTILSIGASLFTMTLLIGIGQKVIDEFSQQLSSDVPVMELFVCMVMSVVLLLLVDKLPQMVAGIVTGAMGGGFQGFGAGTGIAAGTAAAGMAVGAIGGLAAAAGAISSNAAGGVEAIRQAAALADTQMGIGGSPMGEGGNLGASAPSSNASGPSNNSSSSTASGSAGGGAERMSGSWLAQVGKNLAQATSAGAMETISEKVQSAIEGSAMGKVADRIKQDREDLAQSETTDEKQKTEGSQEGNEPSHHTDSSNSIGGISDNEELPSELRKFVEGDKNG